MLAWILTSLANKVTMISKSRLQTNPTMPKSTILPTLPILQTTKMQPLKYLTSLLALAEPAY